MPFPAFYLNLTLIPGEEVTEIKYSPHRCFHFHQSHLISMCNQMVTREVEEQFHERFVQILII